MSEHVWVSDLLGNEASYLAEVRGESGPGGRRTDGAKMIGDGQPAPPGYGPIRLWDSDSTTEDQHSGYPVNIAQEVPEVFLAGGYWIVSERIADILRRFDLGEGAVYPVSEGLYLRDGVTRIPGEYFSWAVVDSKSAYDPDSSINVRKHKIPGLWDKMPFELSDEDIAVSSGALTGPDTWLDDGLLKSLFLSGPLGDALEAAGLKEALSLYKARVV